MCLCICEALVCLCICEPLVFLFICEALVCLFTCEALVRLFICELYHHGKLDWLAFELCVRLTLYWWSACQEA